MVRRFLLGCLLAFCALARSAAQDRPDPPVRRAIPVEPPTAPAVPFDFDKPAPRAQPVNSGTGVTNAPDEQTSSEIRVAPSGTVSPDEAQMNLANGYYTRKSWDMAAPEYERYLGVYANAPGRQTAFFRLGESYRNMGNLNAAKNSYETLLASFVTGDFIGPAAFRLADLLFKEGDFRGALPLYRKATVRVKDPTVINAAKYYTGRCLQNTEDNTEARAVYTDLIDSKENNPFREAGQLALAELDISSNRKPEALKQYQAILKESEKPELKAEAQVKIGLIEIDLAQPDKAAADLKKALDMPDLGKLKEVAELGLLRILFDSGKYKQVIDTIDSENGDFSQTELPEVLLLGANANRQMGNHEAAQKSYDQVAHDYPNSVYAKEAGYERLVSLYDSNDPNVIKAIDEYLAQSSEPEKRDEVILMKAEALFKKQDFAGAAPLYASLDHSSLTGFRKAVATFKLGWCEMQSQDYEKAVTAFSDFLDGYPSNKLVPAALGERALAYKQLKNFPAALKDCTELINHYPKAREREIALLQKALILGHQSDNTGMAATFQQLLKDYPKTEAAAQANYWIGSVAFDAKDYKNAVAPLTQARNLDPTQYFETASLHLIQSDYYLEEKNDLAAEIDQYVAKPGKTTVPPDILRWLGTTYFKDENFPGAEKYLALLTSHDKDHAAADDWLNLGRSELKQEKYEPAAKSFKVYLDLSKEPFPRATGLLALGETQLGLKQYDDAQKSADEALSLQPEGELNARGRELSGDIQNAGGDFEAAAKLYQSVAVVFDDPVITPRCMEKACNAYKKAGKAAEAAKILNSLQSRYPEYQLTNKT